MVGRAAQGAPWVFGQIAAFFESGELIADPDLDQMHQILLGHLQALYAHYGEYSGCRIARKHIAWYTGGPPDSNRFRAAMYEFESTASQFQFVDEFFESCLRVCSDHGFRVVREMFLNCWICQFFWILPGMADL